MRDLIFLRLISLFLFLFLPIFSHKHATLHLALSVGPSNRPSIHLSLRYIIELCMCECEVFFLLFSRGHATLHLAVSVGR